MKNLIKYVIAFALSVSPLISQKLSPSLDYKDGKTSKSLKIQKTMIDVKIVGSLAVTTMDITFNNETSKTLEGEFSFPLGENASVSRFALEINNKLREGVVVEKEKGRKTFEAIERRGVDPGLLEQTKGNVFRFRVFPIQANRSKRIVIAYEERIDENSESATYRLPLDFKEAIDTFSLSIKVYGEINKPDASKSEMTGINFSKNQNAYAFEKIYYKYCPNKQFEIEIPPASEKTTAMTEKIKDEQYFEVIAKPSIKEKEKPNPRKIAIYWDASSSMEKRDIDKELELLGAYLSKIKNCSVDLVLFGIKANSPENWQITNGDWSSLKDRIKSIAYDGGTQLGALDFSALKADEILLFSDGMSNFGKKEILLSNIPIYSISSTQTADRSYLSYISKQSGGAYINLLQNDSLTSFNLLSKLQYRLLSVESADAKDIFPSEPTIIKGALSIVGKLNSENGTIKLNYGFGSEISESETITIDAKRNSVNSGVMNRIWAQKKISELDERYEKNKDEITKVAKEYSIVTRNTSLIVLENISDYFLYNIPLPDELKSEYDSLKAKYEKYLKQSDDTTNDSLADAKKIFKSFYSWYMRNYKLIYPNTSMISGRIYKDSITPINGARIEIEGANQLKVILQSDSTGYFEAYNLPYGAYKINLSYKNKMPYSENIELKVNKDYHNIFVLGKGNSLTREKQTKIKSKKRSKKVVVQYPTTDDCAREAVQVMTGAFSAEYGNALGGVVRNNRARNVANGNSNIQQNTVNYSSPLIASDSRAGDIQVDIDGLNSDHRLYIRGSRPEETQVTIDGLNSKNKKMKINIDSLNKLEFFNNIDNLNKDTFVKQYFELKKTYGSLLEFYVEASNTALSLGEKELAIKILSNLAEMQNENQGIERTLGRRLMQMGYNNYAIDIFKEVLKERAEEPQSYRDLALAYAGNREYQLATDLLYSIAIKKWDYRFPEIQNIAIEEMNNIIQLSDGKVNTANYDTTFVKNMKFDLAVVLDWDLDNTDLDLWIIDPNGEKCYYGNRFTKNGGRLSRDFTGGYGPEIFLVKKTVPGIYKIKANYFGSRAKTQNIIATLTCDIYKNYGSPDQEKKSVIKKLKSLKGVIDIGEFEVK